MHFEQTMGSAAMANMACTGALAGPPWVVPVVVAVDTAVVVDGGVLVVAGVAAVAFGFVVVAVVARIVVG